VTLIGEKEEKANTIQPPLLVFFSPSKSRGEREREREITLEKRKQKF